MYKFIFSIHKILYFLIVVFYIVSCNNYKNNIALSSGDTSLVNNALKPLVFTDSQQIKWSIADSNTIKSPIIQPFDFTKLPYKPLNAGLSLPLPTPAQRNKLTWNTIPDSAFNPGELIEQSLKRKTYILPKPKLVKTTIPEIKENACCGIMQFGMDQGLPGNKLTDILQDANGTMWMIIKGTLCRYDGENLEKYQLAKTPILSRIMLDKSGNIWASSYNNGFYIINVEKEIQEHISNITVVEFDFMEDNNNLVWLGTYDEGIYIIDHKKSTIKNFRRYKGKTELNSIYSFKQDRNGGVWAPGMSGVCFFDLQNKKVKFLDNASGFPFVSTTSVLEDNEGRIWISAFITDTGISIISAKKDSIYFLGPKQGISRQVINMMEDNSHNVWLNADSVIYVVSREFKTIKRIATNEKVFENDFGTLLLDQAGLVWLGTRSGGINIINSQGLMPDYLDASTGLSGSSVWGLAEDRRGKIWISGLAEANALDRGFINIIDSTREKIYDVTKIFPWHIYSADNLFTDKKGKVWASVQAKGIFSFDQYKNEMIQFGINQGVKIDSSNSYQILEDRHGFIWIGSSKGLQLLDPSSGIIRSVMNLADLKLAAIYCFFESSSGQVWIGTSNYGLFVVDPANQTMKHVLMNKSVPSNSILSISEDNDHRIWAATENGVFVFNTIDQNYFALYAADGINADANYMLRKVNKKMFVGSGNGLSVLSEFNNMASEKKDRPRYHIDNYNRTNGLLYRDFHSLSLYSTDEKFWAPIDQKILAVLNDPEQVPFVYPAFISGISLLDKPLDFSRSNIKEVLKNSTDTLWDESNNTFFINNQRFPDDGYLQKNNIELDNISGLYHTPVNLRLPYTQNSLSFQFGICGFLDRDKIRYRYILEGIDREWSAVTEKRFSENYRNLTPGKYSFKVTAKTSNDIWSKPAEFTFTILPPWWKTWWAYSLYVLAFATLVWAFIQYRSRRLKAENLKLETKVKNRTNELHQSLKELKETQSQLIQSEKMASLGELTAGIAHEIQNPLNFVNNFSEVSKELLEEMKVELENGNMADAKDIASDVIQNLEKINHHGKRADAIVKGMLQHSRSSSGQKELTDINALADEYLRLAYHGLRAKDKSFNAIMKTDFDPTIGKINIIPQDMGRVILNLITNAFYAVTEKKKQQPGNYEPTVTITTKKNDNKILISVKDNGNGIPQKVLDKIFQPFFTTKPTGQGTGLGLSMSYDIVTKGHNGELMVETKEGEGAEFIIILHV